MDERRYYGLDALRGSMMMLGIVLHAAGFYVQAPPPTLPLQVDRNTSYVFDVVFHFIHSFRMPVFFVLDFMLSVRFGTHDWLPDLSQLEILRQEMLKAGLPVDEPTLGHLWFLYYLCFFYLLIPVCRLLVKRSLAIEPTLAMIVHALCTWTFIYLLIGGALRFFDHESPWILYISQSSYWVFLVHLPAVCFAAWWMVQYDLPAMVKFLIVAAFTTFVCLITYHYGCRTPG